MQMKKYLKFESKYDRHPINEIEGFDHEAWSGCDSIINELKHIKNGVICFECYPGVDLERLENDILKKFETKHLYNIEKCTMDINIINRMIERNVTNDRVFGLISHHEIVDFYDQAKVNELIHEIENKDGLKIVYGFGASLINKFDKLVYIDLARWEIQQRYRRGLPNWLMDNHNEDNLRKFKRGYFVEWRVANRLKKALIQKIDYIMDYNDLNTPKMISIDAFHAALDALVTRPFRLVPYFDPGVWGGQWMKEVCNLDSSKRNYAWSFDGVPEENSLKFKFGDVVVELPALNLVFFRPIQLLGHKVHARFGTEFPIRFDFLDTMEGGNLSLQVHPLTEYIQDQFGMNYTQDESYYILDAEADACVYLGTKEGINPDDFIRDLKRAENGEIVLDDTKYINQFPAKKHDHFLIPAGTIHCSGKNTMVLEISATPYIFTFKLWDWGRVGLDGIPRPVHINHGVKNIQFDRTTKWVEENLINRFEKLSEIEEKTGLHEREFIETRRFFFTEQINLETSHSVNMLNLVEGEACIVESLNQDFIPFVVHYAETFIIPENVKHYSIKPFYENQRCGVIKAYVR